MANTGLLLEGEDLEEGGERMTVDEGKKGEKRAATEKEEGRARKTASGAGPSAGKNKEKGKKGGGKGKEEEPVDKKHIGEAMKENKVLMTLIMKQILNSAQCNRDVQGVLFETWLMPIGTRIVELAKKQNLKYSEKVKVRGHGLGPPHLYTFGGVLAGIQELKKGSEMEEKINKVVELYIKMSVVEKGEIAKFCRISKIYDTTKYRVTMCFGPAEDAVRARAIIMTAMHSLEEEMGFEFKQGRPPPSYMEREIGSWLQALLEQ